MTGRRLYDALTDGWASEQFHWNAGDGKLLRPTPPAWMFLQANERRAFNVAARSLTPRPKKVKP